MWKNTERGKSKVWAEFFSCTLLPAAILHFNCEIQMEYASWHEVPFVQEWTAAAGPDAALNGVKVQMPESLFSKFVPMACAENLLVAIWKNREFKGGVLCLNYD